MKNDKTEHEGLEYQNVIWVPVHAHDKGTYCGMGENQIRHGFSQPTEPPPLCPMGEPNVKWGRFVRTPIKELKVVEKVVKEFVVTEIG